MADVSAFGLGSMGTALARALVCSKFRAAVWNRTLEKKAALEEIGAIGPDSALAAMEASPIVLVCVSNYAQATLGAYHGAVDKLQSHAKAAGINSELPDFLSSLFTRAVSAELIDEEYVALIKVLGKDSEA